MWSSSQVLEVFQLLWEEIDTCIWYFCSTMCCVPYACYLLFVFVAPDAVRTYIYLKHIKVLINFIFTRQTLPFNWWLDNCKSCLFLAVMQEMSVFLTTFVIGFPYTMFLFKPDLPQDVVALHIAWLASYMCRVSIFWTDARFSSSCAHFYIQFQQSICNIDACNWTVFKSNPSLAGQCYTWIE